MEDKGFVRIGWFLTDVCNLRCKHCYHEEFSYIVDVSKQQQYLEKRIINEIINLSKSWDIETIGLLGGEPLLHPHIFEYIETLAQSICCNITIATNGLLINDEMIELMKKFQNLQVQISLDSPISDEHNFYRGNGTYENTIAIIRKLVDNNLKPIIRMTVSDVNFNSMEDFVKLGIQLNVASVSINKYIADKNCPSNYLKPVSSVKHDEFLNKLIYLKKTYGEEFVFSEDPCLNDCNREYIMAEFEEELKENLPIGGCSAGLCNITIGKDGKIYPCTLLPLEVGDITKQHLIDIWENENEILNNLRDRINSLKGKCAKCESILICGGCRASAYKMTGDYLAEDPFCNKKVK